MAQSPEYPDLRWVPPRSSTNANRTAVQLIVIHTTEGAERSTSAEDGAAYDARRTDGTSTHYFHDSNSTVQCVRTEDQAHAARTQGNRRGIQHELCGRAGQGNTGWADDASQGTLRRAAKQAARDAKKWGIPVRHLTVGEVAAGVKGFCGHVDITYAFPADNGTHTDPGPTFPWTQFLNLVRAELAPQQEEPEMELTDRYGNKAYPTRTVQQHFNDMQGLRDTVVGDAAGTTAAAIRATSPLGKVLAMPAQLDALGKALIAAIAAAGTVDVDEDAIVTGVLAGLTPERIVAGIPEGIAQEVVDLLTARLQA